MTTININTQGNIPFEIKNSVNKSEAPEILQDFFSLLNNQQFTLLNGESNPEVLNSHSFGMQSSEFLSILESTQAESCELENYSSDLSKLEYVSSINLLGVNGLLNANSSPGLTASISIENQSELLIDTYLSNKLIEQVGQYNLNQFVAKQNGLIEDNHQFLTKVIYVQSPKSDVFEFSGHNSTVVNITAPLASIALGVESQSYSFVNVNLHIENNTLKLGTVIENIMVSKLEPLGSMFKPSSVKFSNYFSLIVSEFSLSKNVQAKSESIIRNNPSFAVLFDNKWLEQNITIVREEDSVELWIRDFKSSKSRLDSLVSNLLNQLNNSTVNKVIVNGEVVINIKELKNAN